MKNKRLSLRDRLDRMEQIEKYLEEEEKKKKAPKQSFMDKVTGKKSLKKKYKLPKKLIKITDKKLKENYAIVAYVRTNGHVDFDHAPIENDRIYIKQTGKYYAATADYILRHKKWPLIIILEHSLEPVRAHALSLKKHLYTTIKEGKVSWTERFLVNLMKDVQIGPPKKAIGGKTILWILAGGVAVLYLISQILQKGGG